MLMRRRQELVENQSPEIRSSFCLLSQFKVQVVMAFAFKLEKVQTGRQQVLSTRETCLDSIHSSSLTFFYDFT